VTNVALLSKPPRPQDIKLSAVCLGSQSDDSKKLLNRTSERFA
jgi:hypothetical protein